MNRRHPIVLHRSMTRRTRFAAQILLRGASRRAARVFKTDALGQVVSARFGEDADPDLYGSYGLRRRGPRRGGVRRQN